MDDLGIFKKSNCGLESCLQQQMQNSKYKMQNYGVAIGDDLNHFRRKYHYFAFCIQHSAFRATARQTEICKQR